MCKDKNTVTLCGPECETDDILRKLIDTNSFLTCEHAKLGKLWYCCPVCLIVTLGVDVPPGFDRGPHSLKK